MTTVALCENCDDPESCVLRFREKASALDLEVTMDGRLATLPGSVHLHLRRRGERSGTLEYTMDVRNGRSWLSWTEKRHRPWVDDAVRGLTSCETLRKSERLPCSPPGPLSSPDETLAYTGPPGPGRREGEST